MASETASADATVTTDDRDQLRTAARRDPYDFIPRDLDLGECFDFEVVDATDTRIDRITAALGRKDSLATCRYGFPEPDYNDDELVEEVIDSARFGTQILNVVANHKEVKREGAEPELADTIYVVRRENGHVAVPDYATNDE